MACSSSATLTATYTTISWPVGAGITLVGTVSWSVWWTAITPHSPNTIQYTIKINNVTYGVYSSISATISSVTFPNPGATYTIGITAQECLAGICGGLTTSILSTAYVRPFTNPVWPNNVVTFSRINPVVLSWTPPAIIGPANYFVYTIAYPTGSDILTESFSGGIRQSLSSSQSSAFTTPGTNYSISIAVKECNTSVACSSSATLTATYTTINWSGGITISILSGSVNVAWPTLTAHSGNTIKYTMKINSENPQEFTSQYSANISTIAGTSYVIIIEARECYTSNCDAPISLTTTYLRNQPSTPDWDSSAVTFSGASSVTITWPARVPGAGCSMSYTVTIGTGTPSGFSASNLSYTDFTIAGHVYNIEVTASNCNEFNECGTSSGLQGTYTTIDWPADAQITLSGLWDVAWPIITPHTGNTIKYTMTVNNVSSYSNIETATLDPAVQFLTFGETYVIEITAQECLAGVCGGVRTSVLAKSYAPCGVCSWMEWEPIRTSEVAFELMVLILRKESLAADAIISFRQTLTDSGIGSFSCANCFNLFITSMYTLSSDQRIQCTQDFYSDECQVLLDTFMSDFHTCAGYKFGWSVITASTHIPSKAPRPEPMTTMRIDDLTTTAAPVTTTGAVTSISPFETTTKGDRPASVNILISAIIILFGV